MLKFELIFPHGKMALTNIQYQMFYIILKNQFIT